MVEKVISLYADAIFKDHQETGWFATDNITTNASRVVGIQLLMEYSHSIAAARGWWHKKLAAVKNDPVLADEPASYALRQHDVGNRFALMHTELSEAFEGTRKDAMDEHLPEFTSETVELADLLHRVFDYAKARDLKLGEAFVAKAIYNTQREDHSLEARSKVGGKQF